MSLATPNMGLTAWTDTDDPYAHTVLSNNWAILDAHDHKDVGVHIPLGGLANGAVDAAALATNAVTTPKIINGAITFAKLDTKVLTMIPLGTAFPWWRPNLSSPLPSGLWVAAVGQTLGPTEHDFPGGGNIVLPNLVQHFPFGAEADGANIGNTGGNNSIDLSHTHVVNPHTHTVNGHTHTVNAHGHTVNSHAHGIAGDGVHSHGFYTGPATRGNNNYANAAPHNENVAFQDHVHGGETDGQGGHSHGGATGGSSPGTDAQSPGTSATALTTNPTTGSTASALGITDIRPAFVAMYWIVRVKLTY